MLLQQSTLQRFAVLMRSILTLLLYMTCGMSEFVLRLFGVCLLAGLIKSLAYILFGTPDLGMFLWYCAGAQHKAKWWPAGCASPT